MARPGTITRQLQTTVPRNAPTNTGVWFVAGQTYKGPTSHQNDITGNELRRVTSIADFTSKFGGRQTYSVLYDALDAFFHEGGSVAYVARVMGPAAAYATLTLNATGPIATFTVKGLTPGAWGNSIKIQVTAGIVNGSAYIIHVFDSSSGSDIEMETSPELVDKPSALAWAAASNYITLTDTGAGGNPIVVAKTALASGNDDLGSVVEAQWTAAYATLTKDLGPGQVSAPGRVTSAARSALLAHAAANNRVAILDHTDTATTATMTAEAVGLQTDANSAYGGMFGPWVIAPGLPSTQNQARRMPPCGFVAGNIAQTDSQTGNPNQAAAGVSYGICSYALDVGVLDLTDDTTRQNMNSVGSNLIRNIYGQVVIYGFRSLTSPVNNPNYVQLSNVRLFMTIAALGDAIGQRYVFSQLDGQGVDIGHYGGEIGAMLNQFYILGALYGLTPAQAFNVDVGPTVNTLTTIANGELHAALALKLSRFAEIVYLDITTVGLAGAVA